MFHYVYQLTSITDPERHYTGLTRDLKRRIKQHNQGEVQATADHIPWRVEVAIAFRDASKATSFEQYLKSHSGRGFSKRHF
jgi:predicted GIY-YIG superfamily endonuclease